LPRDRHAGRWFNAPDNFRAPLSGEDRHLHQMEAAMSYPLARTAVAIAISALTLAAARAETGEKLGTVSFASSCSAAVQPQLQRSVALLHSFWWSEGDKSFREVLAQDPSCAIATWGIAALAIGNPYATGATPEGAKRAQEAIAQGRAIGAKTERERGYIEAVAAYYDKFAERPHAARLRSMADAFEALAKQYPDDDETQIFSAIYLVSTQPPADKTFARAMQGAAILEAQFQKHRDHPGVAHYLIHAYDYPPIADKGLNAAMCYADIAPSAPHALHMPSHIFTRVGLWQESAATNRRASAAATGEAERSDRLHALDYLVYASLQLARDKDAAAGADEARQVTGSGATALASVYARAAIPARQAIERGLWQEAAKLDDPDKSNFPFTEAMRYFGRALGAARSGNPAAAEKDLDQLRQIGETLKAAKNDYWATEVEVQRLSVEAWIAFAKGQRDQALAAMRNAADIEDKSEKHPVSPGRLIPARELLGDMLLESGRPAEALTEYEASQIRDPKRFRGYWGAGQAAAQAGNKEKAQFYFRHLVELAGSGDPRPETAKAREYLAMK
jgi:tetratricopeptide (TPR) repeat protein